MEGRIGSCALFGRRRESAGNGESDERVGRSERERERDTDYCASFLNRTKAFVPERSC